MLSDKPPKIVVTTERDLENSITEGKSEDEQIHEGDLGFKREKGKTCSYCLRRDMKGLLVLDGCGHFFCPHCLLSQYLISTVTQGIGVPATRKLVRCYVCKQYEPLTEKQVSQLKSLVGKVKPPPTNAPVFKGLKRCQTCFKVSLNVD